MIDSLARAPPEIVDRVIPPSPLGYGAQAEPWIDDPFPDYDTEPGNLSSVALDRRMAYANG